LKLESWQSVHLNEAVDRLALSFQRSLTLCVSLDVNSFGL
jgi:hypothetical protein